MNDLMAGVNRMWESEHVQRMIRHQLGDLLVDTINLTRSGDNTITLTEGYKLSDTPENIEAPHEL